MNKLEGQEKIKTGKSCEIDTNKLAKQIAAIFAAGKECGEVNISIAFNGNQTPDVDLSDIIPGVPTSMTTSISPECCDENLAEYRNDLIKYIEKLFEKGNESGKHYSISVKYDESEDGNNLNDEVVASAEVVVPTNNQTAEESGHQCCNHDDTECCGNHQCNMPESNGAILQYMVNGEWYDTPDVDTNETFSNNPGEMFSNCMLENSDYDIHDAAMFISVVADLVRRRVIDGEKFDLTIEAYRHDPDTEKGDSNENYICEKHDRPHFYNSISPLLKDISVMGNKSSLKIGKKQFNRLLKVNRKFYEDISKDFDSKIRSLEYYVRGMNSDVDDTSATVDKIDIKMDDEFAKINSEISSLKDIMMKLFTSDNNGKRLATNKKSSTPEVKK